MLAFDTEGEEALKAACISSDPTARARALLGIAACDTTAFSIELGTALESDAISDEGRKLLSEVLVKRFGKLPEPQAVQAYLQSAFKRSLDNYQLVRTQPNKVPQRAWSISADGKLVQARDVSAADHALEALYEVADHRLHYAYRTRQDLIDCATVALQHAYQSQPGFSASDAIWQTVKIPADELNIDFWKQVMDRSQTWQMHGAALRAAQAIGRSLPGSPAGAPAFDFMASCLRDSRPAMRYVAVDAISKANVESAYNGAGTALETAVEMTRLGQGPLVLVIGLTGDLRLAAEQQLLALGARSIPANSLQAALQILDQPYPVEMILIVDRLPRNGLLAAVDRLRHSKRGGALPIAILTDDVQPLERLELQRTSGITFSVLSQLPDHMPRVLSEMAQQLDTRPLSGEERLALAESAARLLATISSNREKFDFYPLARWEKELTTLADALPEQTYMNVLSGLGTLISQQQLVQMVANKAVAEAKRKSAADAFQKSVAQFGLLLGRKDIEEAYRLYNVQGPSDAVTVVALGQVLDAIESRTGKGEVDPAP